MIILTAGHTGAGTGAQCITTQFDEGAENIWLRNRIAEILTNKYGLVVLVDDDKASLKLLVKELSRDTACRVLSVNRPNERLKPIPISADTIEITLHSRDAACCVRSTSGSKNNTSNERTDARQDTARRVPTSNDFVIDLHFNAHTNPQAGGTETIVADDATELELRMASRLAHATADSLEIPLRGIKSESETPHRRLAMLHLTPQSIILEVCFCTSPEDVEQYRRHRRKIASTIARTIAELIE